MNDAGDQDVALLGWLTDIGLEKYHDLFRENEIGLDILPEIEAADLKELEIPLGDRKRLLRAIGEMGQSGSETPRTTSQPDDTSGAVRQAERRHLTVLFCDLVGSTGLATKFDPEDTSAMIQAYQNACTDIVKRWGGFVSQYLGDGIMAYFGWPIGQEKDAERAVRAGFAMVEATAQLSAPDGQPLAARVGVATGLVMVGEIIGEASSKQETAIGATPNVAAKLQSIAKPNGVAIADSVRPLLPASFDLTDLGMNKFSGLDEEIKAWSVDSLTRREGGIWGQVEQRDAKLIGRSSELRILNELWGQAKSGIGSAAQIIAETGVGKSSLVTAFFEDIALDPKQLVRLRGSSFHTATSFFPIIEEIQRLADLQTSDPPDTAIGKLTALLDDIGIPGDPGIGLLARLLDIPFDGDPAVKAMSAQLRRTQTIDLIVEILLKVSPGGSAVLLVEDVHWLDPSSMVVLDKLLDAVSDGAPLLLLITLRPEQNVRDWSARIDAQTLRLRTLNDEQVRGLILEHTDGLPLPEPVTQKIMENTDGVPLFVQEITKGILESNQLEKRRGSYALRNKELQLDVPSTLQGSLVARLDKRPSAKPIAQAAATIGRFFSPELLARVTGLDMDILEVHLEDLVSFGVLGKSQDAQGQRYSFVHALVQETAYRSQLKPQRRKLHGQIAEALSDETLGHLDNQPELLAHHFGHAGQQERAGFYFLAAGRRSISHSAVAEALTHLERGLALIQPLPPAPERDLLEMRLQASVGTALMLSKGWAAPEVQHTYLHAASLSDAAQSVKERLWIMWGAWVSRHVHGRINSAIEMSHSVTEIANEAEERSGLLIAEMIQLQTAFYSGRFQNAVDHCERMRALFRPHKDRSLVNLYSTDLEMVALVHQSIAHWAMGQCNEANALLELAEKTARKLDHGYTLSWVLVWGATVPLVMGDLQRAKSMVDEGRAFAVAQGYDYVISLSSIQAGFIHFTLTNDDKYVDDMLEGIEAFQSTGAEIAVPHFKSMVANVLLQGGKPDKALNLLTEAEQQITDHGERWQLSSLLRFRAKAMQHGNSFTEQEIEETYQRSIKVAQDQGAQSMALRGARSYARYLCSLGRFDDANERLDQVVSTCGPEVNCEEFDKARESMRDLVK